MAASRRARRTIATKLATVHRVDFPTTSKVLRRVVFKREEDGGGVEEGLVLAMVMLLLVWVRKRLRLGEAGGDRRGRVGCDSDGKVARWGGTKAAAVGSDAAVAAMRRRPRPTSRGRRRTA